MEEIYGQEFTDKEVRQMQNFSDLAKSYFLAPEQLIDYLDCCKNLGGRLYIAVKVPVEQLGSLLLQMQEPRLIAVIKKRLEEERLEESGGIHI